MDPDFDDVIDVIATYFANHMLVGLYNVSPDTYISDINTYAKTFSDSKYVDIMKSLHEYYNKIFGKKDSYQTFKDYLIKVFMTDDAGKMDSNETRSKLIKTVMVNCVTQFAIYIRNNRESIYDARIKSGVLKDDDANKTQTEFNRIVKNELNKLSNMVLATVNNVDIGKQDQQLSKELRTKYEKYIKTVLQQKHELMKRTNQYAEQYKVLLSRYKILQKDIEVLKEENMSLRLTTGKPRQPRQPAVQFSQQPVQYGQQMPYSQQPVQYNPPQQPQVINVNAHSVSTPTDEFTLSNEPDMYPDIT